MLKNAKIFEIGPRLDMPPAGQSFVKKDKISFKVIKIVPKEHKATYSLSRDADSKNQMDIIQSVKTQSVYYIHWSISHLLLRQQQLTFNTFPSTLKFSHEKGRNKKKYNSKWVL